MEYPFKIKRTVRNFFGKIISESEIEISFKCILKRYIDSIIKIDYDYIMQSICYRKIEYRVNGEKVPIDFLIDECYKNISQ